MNRKEILDALESCGIDKTISLYNYIEKDNNLSFCYDGDDYYKEFYTLSNTTKKCEYYRNENEFIIDWLSNRSFFYNNENFLEISIMFELLLCIFSNCNTNGVKEKLLKICNIDFFPMELKIIQPDNINYTDFGIGFVDDEFVIKYMDKIEKCNNFKDTFERLKKIIKKDN